MLTFSAAVSVALVVSFLCSIMESVLLSVGAADVETLVQDNKRSGRLLKEFKRNIDVPIAAILIVNTIAHTVGASVAGATYENAFDGETLWIFTIIFTTAVLLFTEIIPKTVGVTHAKHLAGPVAFSIRFLVIVLRPIVWITSYISRALRGNKDGPATSVDEIRVLAALARSEGVFGASTAGMIVGATRLRQLRAQDVIVSRQNVIFLSAEKTLDENLRILRASNHSRLPFSQTDDLDSVTGIVLARELLYQIQDRPGEDVDWNALIREPLTIPESKSLTSLLRDFQTQRSPMAIVIDEYGGVEGIVTLEDVLEEVVGEIIDEGDRQIEEMWSRANGELEVRASVEMRRIGDHFGFEWDSDLGVSTVGGLVTDLLGRIPIDGDAVEWQGYRFEVLSASATRAERILITAI
jgi:CBS domain containing-hemolysin-like protein